MNRLGMDVIDRELGSWLREESAVRAPAGLVEDVFARTTRTRQLRRWWPPAAVERSAGGRLQVVALGRRPAAWGAPVVAGLAVLLLVAILAGTLRPFGTGPGTFPSPSTAPSMTPAPSPSLSGPPTPAGTTLGTFTARRLSLGVDAAPIGVIDAFGSIWVADIHADDVRRYDPLTMLELARIPVPSAAWFAVADGALWVTSQTDTGVSRIDPATNRVVAHVGDVAPCGAPVVAFGSLWQAACDAGVFLEIDPVTNAVVRTIPANGHIFLVLAGGQLITVASSGGLARLDPDTGSFTTIANRAATGVEFIASDGTTVWLKNTAGVVRIDPTDGRTLASLPSSQAAALAFAGDHAWLTTRRDGVLEIALATSKVTRSIPVPPAPLVPLEANGVLWVTDFEGSVLWRIEP